MLQNQYKKNVQGICFPDTHGYFFPPHFHHGNVSSECEWHSMKLVTESAMSWDGLDTHTQEMVSVLLTESVLRFR